MKKYIIVAWCFLLALFCGCQSQSSRSDSELWIVTEQSTWDRMNGQLYVLEEAYEKAHPGVAIRVEYLPTGAQERDVYLQQLRTEIIQGGGPDCYLLPTSNTLILDEPARYTYVDIEPLFADVDLAMRNGLFYDITELYDADDALDREGLNDAIMAAGVVEGVRYVLPLRYDMPVIYGQHEALEAAGLDPAILHEDIHTIMEAVYASGDPILASGLLYGGLDAFSGFIDYETANATLDEGTLYRYLENYQNLKSLLADSEVPGEKLNINKFIDCIYSGEKTDYYPLWIGTMQDTFDYVSLSKYQKTGLTVAPLRTDAGEIVATVTYYAAVGSGCKNPELAYDFLRQFLLEESQLETNRPERNHTKPKKQIALNTSNDLQCPGLIENGWPVRDKNTLTTLWNVRRLQLYIRGDVIYGEPEHARRLRGIGFTGVMEEERAPILGLTIDQVRFNASMSAAFADTLALLNGPDKWAGNCILWEILRLGIGLQMQRWFPQLLQV